MSREIIRTVYHFKDDKGWTYEMIAEGDICPHTLYRIPKRASMREAPKLLSNDPPSMPMPMKHYEFDLVRESYEHFSLFYYIKHLFYEMV
jgi:hypothetical protein